MHCTFFSPSITFQSPLFTLYFVEKKFQKFTINCVSLSLCGLFLLPSFLTKSFLFQRSLKIISWLFFWMCFHICVFDPRGICFCRWCQIEIWGFAFSPIWMIGVHHWSLMPPLSYISFFMCMRGSASTLVFSTGVCVLSYTTTKSWNHIAKSEFPLRAGVYT